jgi:glycosyltransferase involved in cell wall biosynthesis/2-polyprenyl-3-methyl-5-hydroxy-6-metoxy-1,4-benzoquinol methylase/GT2 family glycosyltransferase/organic radical activating enzyme
MDKEKKYNLVYFEIVGFCNARCPWCVTGNKSLNQVSYPSRFINVNDFRNAIVKLLEGGLIYPRETIIRLENWGEPMLHPELSEILKILKKNDVNFAFSTNASKFVNLENDVLGNLQEIRFSVPGFSQSSYDRIHGFNLESILKNIEMFCKNIRKEGSGAKLVMAYHLYQFNIGEIDAAMKFCSLNGIEFSPYSAYLNDFNLAKAYLNKSISTELLGRIGKDLFLHYVDELIARTPQDYQCPQFNILAIDEYCNVLTCCALPKDHPEYSLGNLFTLSSGDIRKGKVSQKVCIECVKLGISSWVHNPWVPDFINIKEGDGGHLTRCKKNQAMDIIETGFCIICGQNSTFRFDNGIITPQLKDVWGITDEMADAFNHRESQFCSFCGSSLRVRQLCTALIQTFSEMSGRAYDSFTDLLEDAEFRRLRIAEINACGAFHNYLKQHPNLYYSEYVPGVPCGSEYNGIRCEDLQELTYPNDYFDIILTSDTLEHVPDLDKAWSEIRRTLKLGGYHIFTIPVVPSQPITRQRARLSGGRTEYLTEPAYHGREWGVEDQLVYTDFAMDVVDALNKLGLSTEVLYYKQGNKDVAFVFRSLKQRGADATKMEPAMLEWTGERFLPWVEGAQLHYEHLHRYAFAAHFVKGKKVLDLGCGEGYGTYMLASEAEYVAGVEIDKTTVQHARSRYIKDNLEFMEGSILDMPVKGKGKFDVAVCFEVIEHIAEHDKLLSEVKRLLKDDGLFIVSTPNKAVYTDESDYHNPFHIKELYLDEFKALLSHYFKNIRLLGQRVYAGSNLWDLSLQKHPSYREFLMRKGDFEFHILESELGEKAPLYYIALASNASLKPSTSITDSWLTDVSSGFSNAHERLLAEIQTGVVRIANLETILQERVSQIHSLESQIYELQSEIYQIQHSIVMQLVSRYQRIVERLLRRGTRRRHYYELGLAGIRVILNEGWRSFWFKFRQGRKQVFEVKKGVARQPVSVADPRNAVVLVSHDARTGGASLLALHIARVMREKFNKELTIILLQGGPLESSFRQYGQVFCLQSSLGFIDNSRQANELLAAIKNHGVSYCVTNTVVSGCLVPLFKKHGFYTVSLVHELPTSIEMLGVRDSAENIARHSDKIVFAAEFVKQHFVGNYGGRQERTVVRPQGIYNPAGPSLSKVDARNKLRQSIGASNESFIFLNVGHGDLRKGVDLFIQVAGIVLRRLPRKDVHFLLLGNVDMTLRRWAEHDIARMGIKDRVHFQDYAHDILPIYAGADVFLLTSREDPFPSVALEAMDAGLPVIAFKAAGGIPEALEGGRGIAVPYLDTGAMADAAVELVLNQDKRQDIAEKARQSLKQAYDFEEYVGFLLDFFGRSEYPSGSAAPQDAPRVKPVSVVIPNYNCEKYLAERLQSVISQTYKPHEIIFLDDASTDKGVEVARRILQGSGIKYRIIENKNNEGAFNQWVKGFQLAEGEFVWIAEADDVCEPDFLEKVVPRFVDDEVTLVYTQSQVIDAHSKKIDYSYTSYTADLSPDKWNADYCQSGALEINDGLAIKNTIPNASAAVIRKSAFAGIEDELRQFKVCGDWFTYVYVLRTGKVSFCHNVLNYHRRHSQSVINRSEQTELFYKEILSVQEFVLKNYIVRSAVWEQMKIHTIAEYKRLGCQGQESRDLMRNVDLASRMQDLDQLGQQRTLKQEQRHRIMIIIPDLEFGGGQMFGIMLANFLSATNDVVLYNARPYLINDEIMETISVGVRLWEDSGSPDEAAQIIDTYRIDAVISNVWWADKLAYYAVKDKNVKWVLVMHGCYEALVANPHWDGDFQKIVRHLLLKADHIVYTADKNLKAIESLGLSLKDKLVKINNGFFKPAGFTAKSRADFGVNDSDFVFGLISRAIPEKGWEEAILATVKLNKILENRRAHLFLIGESKYADDLKAKYGKGETIHFVGFQSNLAEWIAMFDAGLLPSYFQSESQPLIIIEFIAHNKPVIATDIGEIRTMLVRDGKQAGILIPTVASTIKVDHLFTAMKRLAFNEDHIYDTLRANCEELFQPYDMKTCAEAYMSLIEKQGYEGLP